MALDLLVKIEFVQSGKVAAEALSCLTPPGPLDWSDTDAALRESILAQLTMCNSIDEYELMSAIGELSRVDPLLVTRFLIARIDLQAAKQELGYDALLHRWDPPLKVRETATFARCLIEVREWMTRVGHDRRSYYRHDDGAELYALLAGDWNDQALAVLGDIGDASSEATLMTVARILAHGPSQVLLQNVALVTKVLRRAEALGRHEGKLIFQALLPTNHGVFVSWSFEPPMKDEQERSRAREIATDLPRGSIESRFFHTLADAVEARLNWTMERAKPRFDGRDW